MPSPKAYLDMILQDSKLSNEGGFRGVCRLVFEKFEKDFWCIGKQPNTIAYVIAGNVSDIYYVGKMRPVTKRYMADIVGKYSMAMYSDTATGSKERYEKFQRKLKKFILEMRNRK